jgi:hypothetical protein
VEARAFALFVDDLVQYRLTSQYRAIPENTGATRALGVELGARGRAGRHVGLAAALTILDARDRATERRLPLRPDAQAYVRPEVRLGALGPVAAARLWCDAAYLGRAFVDPANTSSFPPRLRLGAGAGVDVAGGAVALDVAVRDLLDAGGQDLLGFPLPGRSFLVTAAVREDAP